MRKKKHKRYFLNVIEESIQNPAFFGYRGGRIEVYDQHSKEKYAVYEASFVVPEEMIDDFRKCFDFKEVDKIPRIEFDMGVTLNVISKI